MGMIIKNGVEYDFGSSNTDSSSMEIVTQAEYDALVANGTMDNDKYYFITDESVNLGNSPASVVPYDNTESGLEATNVQDAVDEVNQSLTATNGLKFQFATDGEGNYGYLGADDSFIPFFNLELAYLSINKLMNSDDYVLETLSDKSASVSGTASKSYSLSSDAIQIIKNGMVLAKMEFTVKVTAYADTPESNQDTSSSSMNWYLKLSDGTTLESGAISVTNNHYSGVTRYQTKTSSTTKTIYPMNYALNTTEMIISASGDMASKAGKNGASATANIIDIKLYYVNWQ